MATFLELRNLFGDAVLRNRTEVATVIAADAIAQNSTTETDQRLFWAQRVLAKPGAEADRALLIVLAQNSTQTVAAIQGGSDDSLQNAVNTAVGVLSVGSTLVGN